MNKQERQEIFEAVARHCFAQGKRSADINGNCLYRGPNGIKCAMGIFIPDEKYDQDLETNSISYIINLFPDIFPDFIVRNKNFANSLQILHDNPSNWFNEKDLRDAFKNFGKIRKVKISFLKDLHFPSEQNVG